MSSRRSETRVLLLVSAFSSLEVALSSAASSAAAEQPAARATDAAMRREAKKDLRKLMPYIDVPHGAQL